MASTKADVTYTDDASVSKLGEVRVDIAPYSGTASPESACHVTMAFGLTEIVVTVRVGTSSNVKRTSIDFPLR